METTPGTTILDGDPKPILEPDGNMRGVKPKASATPDAKPEHVRDLEKAMQKIQQENSARRQAQEKLSDGLSELRGMMKTLVEQRKEPAATPEPTPTPNGTPTPMNVDQLVESAMKGQELLEPEAMQQVLKRLAAGIVQNMPPSAQPSDEVMMQIEDLRNQVQSVSGTVNQTADQQWWSGYQHDHALTDEQLATAQARATELASGNKNFPEGSDQYIGFWHAQLEKAVQEVKGGKTDPQKEETTPPPAPSSQDPGTEVVPQGATPVTSAATPGSNGDYRGIQRVDTNRLWTNDTPSPE